MILVDSILCRTEDFASQMFEFYRLKGYAVLQSSVEIETGTHGKHVVKKLDILKNDEKMPDRCKHGNRWPDLCGDCRAEAFYSHGRSPRA